MFENKSATTQFDRTIKSVSHFAMANSAAQAYVWPVLPYWHVGGHGRLEDLS